MLMSLADGGRLSACGYMQAVRPLTAQLQPRHLVPFQYFATSWAAAIGPLVEGPLTNRLGSKRPVARLLSQLERMPIVPIRDRGLTRLPISLEIVSDSVSEIIKFYIALGPLKS